MKNLEFQQGDVLGYRIKTLPSGAKKVTTKNGRIILAEGEATGHHHSIAATPEIELFEENGTLYLRAEEDCTVIHQEHNPVGIKEGIFEIGTVLEYDHFAEEARKVFD